MNIYLKIVITALFFSSIIFTVTYVSSKNLGMSLLFGLLSFIANLVYDYVMGASERKSKKDNK
uniref:EciI protein n=1 Tax=Staphylococcus epidermidis TaxID=1282 RepID=O54219_STAEP|nr:EciI protein [Staphylococcus epidermidis]